MNLSKRMVCSEKTKEKSPQPASMDALLFAPAYISLRDQAPEFFATVIHILNQIEDVGF